jgi:hypothetical protein
LREMVAGHEKNVIGAPLSVVGEFARPASRDGLVSQSGEGK